MTDPSEPYRLIPLSKGQFAKVDAADFDWLMQWKWSASWAAGTKTFYALRSDRTGDKKKTVCMHRAILGLNAGDRRFADHRNGDTLNNTRENLRIATPSQNQQNRAIPSVNTSGYKGVIQVRPGVFVARIKINRKQTHLGTFGSAESAADAYRNAAVEFHGEFARL